MPCKWFKASAGRELFSNSNNRYSSINGQTLHPAEQLPVRDVNGSRSGSGSGNTSTNGSKDYVQVNTYADADADKLLRIVWQLLGICYTFYHCGK